MSGFDCDRLGAGIAPVATSDAEMQAKYLNTAVLLQVTFPDVSLLRYKLELNLAENGCKHINTIDYAHLCFVHLHADSTAGAAITANRTNHSRFSFIV